MSSARRGPRGRRLKVAVVEENGVQRSLLRRVLEADGDIAVVGEAATADEAAPLVRRTRPDAVTMDLQIPGGGVAAIAEVMRAAPTPILVLSVAVQGVWSTRAVEALAAGAADVLPKPVRWDGAAERAVRDHVRAIAGASVRPVAATPAPRRPAASSPLPGRVVALAASTGGPAALATVLCGLGGVPVPVVVVQHLHPDFVPGFVAWLGRTTAVPVRAAKAGERLKPGVAYVAPGHAHLRLRPGLVAEVSPDPPRIHRPSADELFQSVASAAAPGSVGVLLTGMGNDGAAGLLAMQQAGCATFVQDEATSAVFGMPGAALKIGAADKALPVDQLPAAVLSALVPAEAGQ